MDSEQDFSAEQAQDAAYAGAGARLRAARETRNLDLSQIAAETRIPLRHLEAIEAGDFAALPSRTYAIGFSRTYARLLGLDEGAITEAVGSELSDGQARHTAVASGMEPGDPAKLPSAALAWFGAFAALVLAVGLIAFFGSRFGAGTGPDPLTAPPSPVPAIAAPNTGAGPTSAPTPAATEGPVVLTALDRVWVRIYEDGGERLIERELAKDERYTLPAGVVDPRINTARPDLLAITVGGRNVPPLSDKPQTMARLPISASALLARPAPDASASPAARRLAPSPGATVRATPRSNPTPPPSPAPRSSPTASASPARPVAPTPVAPTPVTSTPVASPPAASPPAETPPSAPASAPAAPSPADPRGDGAD